MTAKHTPTPWRLSDKRFNCGTHHETPILNRNGGEVCRVQSIGQDDYETAHRIVRAVNAHDALVEALHSMLNLEMAARLVRYHTDKARAALRLARGEE
jgi:hypothetical protein